MTDRVIVQRVITEDTNGKRRNPDSPTGWERRTGQKVEGFEPEFAYRMRKGEKTLVATGLYKKVLNVEWTPCEGPRTVKYEDREAEGVRGGTVHAEVSWPEDIPERVLGIGFTAQNVPGLDRDDWQMIIEGLIAKRAHLEFSRINDTADPEKSEARRLMIAAQRNGIDSLLETLGVDVSTIQRYDRD